LAYAVSHGEARFVVLDGAEGPAFDALILEGQNTIAFDAPNRLHYLGMRGGEIYLVEAGIAG
jgi:hypothetical protein